MLRFCLFLTRLQWIDRRATSSFVVGITVQTVLLAAAVLRRSADPQQALEMATRAAMLTCISIVLLSGMSNVQNEFRYGTIEKVLLGEFPFQRLLLVRAVASVVVSSPAVLIPFAAAVIKFPSTVGPRLFILILSTYIVLSIICYQVTLVLTLFRNPALAVPWIRTLILFLGLSVVPFPGSEVVSRAVPTGWLLHIPHDNDVGVIVDVTVLVALSAAWTVFFWLTLRNKLTTMVELRLTDGADSR